MGRESKIPEVIATMRHRLVTEPSIAVRFQAPFTVPLMVFLLKKVLLPPLNKARPSLPCPNPARSKDMIA